MKHITTPTTIVRRACCKINCVNLLSKEMSACSCLRDADGPWIIMQEYGGGCGPWRQTLLSFNNLLPKYSEFTNNSLLLSVCNWRRWFVQILHSYSYGFCKTQSPNVHQKSWIYRTSSGLLGGKILSQCCGDTDTLLSGSISATGSVLNSWFASSSSVVSCACSSHDIAGFFFLLCLLLK